MGILTNSLIGNCGTRRLGVSTPSSLRVTNRRTACRLGQLRWSANTLGGDAGEEPLITPPVGSLRYLVSGTAVLEKWNPLGHTAKAASSRVSDDRVVHRSIGYERRTIGFIAKPNVGDVVLLPAGQGQVSTDGVGAEQAKLPPPSVNRMLERYDRHSLANPIPGSG